MIYAPSPAPHMAHVQSPPYMAPIPSPVNYTTPAPYVALVEDYRYYEFYRDSLSTSFSYSDCLSLACYGWFSFLIALDVWFAIKKRATWLPGKAFSLSGVTVQIIAWWTNISSIMHKTRNAHDLASFHQLVVGGRVALCIVIGYLLPGMAAPSVRTFLVLGVSICVQIASETLKVENEAHKENVNCNTSPREENIVLGNREEIANWILFMCITVLGLLSVCTILASKTFHDLLKQRASAVFPFTSEDDIFSSDDLTSTIISPHYEYGRTGISWDSFKDEVLTSWLVSRVCRADYVIARSVLSSAAVVVVTFCIIISLLSSTFGNFSIMDPYDALDYAIFCLLFSFIMIGWILICWRLLSIQSHFSSNRQSWRRFLCLEDFWTRSTVQLINIYDLKRDRQRFPKMEIISSKDWLQNFVKNFPMNIFAKVRMHKLLYLVVVLQLSVVCFSKMCGILLEVIVGKFVYRLRVCMRKEQPVLVPEKYKMILELVCMPGEDPSDLWEANQRSFKEVERLMQEGYKKGEAINSMFTLCSRQWEEHIKTLLNMLQREAFPSILKHFPSAEKQSVRITAVCLISIFLRGHKTKSESLDKLLKACHEAWDMLSFRDECDIDLQANEICLSEDLEKDRDQVSMSAERELHKLQMKYNKLDGGFEEPVIDVQVARGILQELLDECVGFLRSENLLVEEEQVATNLSDSKNWMEIAPKYYLYKLCKLLLKDNKIEEMLQDYEIPDFGALVNKVVQNIIAFSLSRVPDMLVQQCWKWAQEFEEDKLWEAIQRAGKCRGMMESFELKPKLTRNPTKQQTIQGLQRVRGMHSV